MIEQLQKAFDTELMRFGLDNNIVVALENINAPTSTDTPYLAGFLLPSDIETFDLSVTESITSNYQIDVNYASALGSEKTNQMIDLLRQRFGISTYHYFDGICFGVDSLTISPLPVQNGWSQKSITLTISGYIPKL